MWETSVTFPSQYCNHCRSEEKQEQQNIPRNKRIQCCRTLWNSISDMFERLHEQRWAVSATLSDRTITKQNDARTLELIDENWKVIEDIFEASFKFTTTALCSETHVCISLEHPVTNSLLTRHLIPIPGETRTVSEFKEAVATSLRKRIVPDISASPGNC